MLRGSSSQLQAPGRAGAGARAWGWGLQGWPGPQVLPLQAPGRPCSAAARGPRPQLCRPLLPLPLAPCCWLVERRELPARALHAFLCSPAALAPAAPAPLGSMGPAAAAAWAAGAASEEPAGAQVPLPWARSLAAPPGAAGAGQAGPTGRFLGAPLLAAAAACRAGRAALPPAGIALPLAAAEDRGGAAARWAEVALARRCPAAHQQQLLLLPPGVVLLLPAAAAAVPLHVGRAAGLGAAGLPCQKLQVPPAWARLAALPLASVQEPLPLAAHAAGCWEAELPPPGALARAAAAAPLPHFAAPPPRPATPAAAAAWLASQPPRAAAPPPAPREHTLFLVKTAGRMPVKEAVGIVGRAPGQHPK